MGVEDGRICALLPEEELPALTGERVDAKQCYVLPGMIDLHLHGAMGSDFTDATPQAFEAIQTYHASHGVTTVLAGILSVSQAEICAALEMTRQQMGVSGKFARLLGAYLEGPYLSKENKGSHPEECLLVPDATPGDWLTPYTDVIKIMTIAPELPGATELIRDFTKRGVRMSGGHDKAREPDVRRAMDAGMRHTTHIYCVMSEYGRINGVKCPGLTELALSEDGLMVELIADGLHVPYPMVEIVRRCKGTDGICLISDCLRPAGMPMDGALYYMGSLSKPRGGPMIVGEKAAMVSDHSKLAGSLTTLDKAVAGLVTEMGMKLEEAVRMASLTPARALGVADKLGSLEVGKQADFSLMDQEYRIQKVWIKGEQIYER